MKKTTQRMSRNDNTSKILRMCGRAGKQKPGLEREPWGTRTFWGHCREKHNKTIL